LILAARFPKRPSELHIHSKEVDAMFNRALIFAGGVLGARALKTLRPDDFRIGVDSGALFC